MAEFKISRIRYTWRDTWATGTDYIKDDIVRFGGASWVCVRKHTASAFATDQIYLANPDDTDFTPAWIKMTDGYAWRGDWAASTLYNPGDISLYGGVIYLCILSHTSAATFAANDLKWAVYTALHNWVQNWTINTRYAVGDVARYNGIVYRCTVEHTSSTLTNGLEVSNNDGYQDSTLESWEIVYSGVQYRGNWTVNTRYRINDLVKFGGTVFRCKKGHQHANDSTLNFDLDLHWQIEFPGFQKSGMWNNSTVYQNGDIVQHGGKLYYSLTTNYNSNPTSSTYQILDRANPEIDWQVVSAADSFKGDWTAAGQYKTGDVVRRGGYTYRALLDTALTADGSSLDYLDSTNWEAVIPGNDHKVEWIIGNTYAVGDLVTYEGTLWRSNYEHIASNENWPSLDSGSGFFYWDIVLLSGSNTGMKNRGDLLTYNLSRDLVGDGSTFNETSVPIGELGQLATIDDADTIFYNFWGQSDKVRYVSADESIALDDDTDPERGISPFKPFRTIRYACEHIEDLNTASEHYTIRVSTGEYEEVLPIIVPEKVAVVGDELRATQVRPKPANPALANDRPYSLVALDHISDIIQDLFANNTITKAVGNTEDQVFLTETVQVAGPPIIDTMTGMVTPTYIDVTQPITVSPAAATDIQDIISDITDYINFYVAGQGTEPTMTGSNTAVTALGYTNAVLVLEANKNFLAEEVSAFIAQQYPLLNYDASQCKRDIRRYIDAFKYDIIYTGNYKSLLGARYYRNAVLGSEGEDMFYVRDATGISNMTLKGLTGTLNPPRVYELYQRPTGGAFVSLDPGWGPNDTRCWITTRSCYVQNVTTFGTCAVGQKIDGALHNGGNKSIVSNDFTQVISDGIGAWVLNNGRAELVSVFTYYCNIGMFAEDGGVIRATNGNSSYGNIGALADGNDPGEVPVYATINNQTTQATIAAAFAGEINDEILAFEFSHAGENYTRADYTVTGAGVNASVLQEEFRDNAIFEMMVRNDPSGTFTGTPGGSGYSLVGNNAQTGTATTITLATNDANTEADLLGLRIVITSGDGTGQYGQVASYNSTTKLLNVIRESDGQPGWDHIVPGKPIVTTMTTNATYRLEPRITFSDPGFTTTLFNLGTSVSWANVVYGETSGTYTDVTGSAGLGTTLDITPITATWNIVKVGRGYTITLAQGGAGYIVGQTVTIDGEDVGGETIENDITITITAVSDDSTNSILDFDYSGLAASGRFVATPTSATTTSYSEDGVVWGTGTLPSENNWKALAAGEAKFVTVAFGTNSTAYSLDGIAWTAGGNMPSVQNWNSIAYGAPVGSNGLFVAVAGTANAGAVSTNGTTWTAISLPVFGDSTLNEWVDIAYGKGKFVALANSGNIVAVGTYNSITSTISWVGVIMDSVADSSQKDWVSIAYGNNRFVAISSTGDISYSFDTETWYGATAASQDGSTAHNWKQIRYGQGVFFAVGDSGGRDIGADPVPASETTFAATSYDGIRWTNRGLPEAALWSAVAFGNPDISMGDSTASNSTPMWIAVHQSLTGTACKILTGARAIARAIVESGRIKSIRIWEPGSGYSSTPTYTITDPKNTSEAFINPRLGDSVLAQPSWIFRGTNYKTSSTRVTISGDGYADVIPNTQFVTVAGLPTLTGPGTQFRFRGETNYFTVATVEFESSESNGTITGTFRVSPPLDYDYYLEHGAQVEVRERYSQVRITGHDFLDVGSGNFLETNYPELYTLNTYFYAPEDEVVELNGGRVFYTSTDQSGNFRTGELFAVEQATGVVTISADFFDLQGLTELALGGVRLGGSGAIVREFSTDPLFTADSNNVVSTQKAIKSYLANRLNVGGSDLLTASFIAGTVRVGPNIISNTAGLTITIPRMADFSGRGERGAATHIRGSMLAQTMFYKSFNDNGL